MKDKLLSIGEVSRMKGVSPKSLRYYEQLGILTPARVDKHSGYRYYAMSQMIVVDVIITCVELGIPLKSLADYRKPNGLLDIASLLERGRETAVDNIRKAQASLAQIDSYLREAHEQSRIQDERLPYKRTVSCRTIMHTPWRGSRFDAKDYLSLTTSLYNRAAQLGTVPLYQWGMMRTPREKGAQWSVFVEVALGDDAKSEPEQSGDEPRRATGEPERPEGVPEQSGSEPKRSEGEPKQVTDKPERSGNESKRATNERTAFFDEPTQQEITVSTTREGMYVGSRLRGAGFDQCFHDVFRMAEEMDGALIAAEVWTDELDPCNYIVELLEKQ